MDVRPVTPCIFLIFGVKHVLKNSGHFKRLAIVRPMPDCRLLCHLLLLFEECVGFDGVRFHFIIILELDRGGYKYFGVS